MATVTSDGRGVAISKEKVPGDALAFNLGLVARIDSGGPMTALAAQDGRWIAFKQYDVYTIAGDGPNALGVDGGWHPPLLLTADAGCIDWRSVLLTPAGTIFQSDAGFYMIDRSWGVVFIGDRIADTLASFPVVTSAVLMPTVNLALFTVTNAAGELGRILAYDYYHLDERGVGKWSVWDVGTEPFISGVRWKNKHWVSSKTATAAGNTLLEQPTTDLWTDEAAFFPLRIKSPKLSPAGVLHNFRTRKLQGLGENKGAHGLKLSVYYDDNTVADQVETFTENEVADFEPYLFEVYLEEDEHRSYTLEWEDTAATTPTEGFLASAIGIEIGRKRGAYKAPDHMRR
jgi:hypothetical protein